MKIEIDSSSGMARVVDTLPKSNDTYLSKDVVDNLRDRGILDSLEQMNFTINSPQRIWEIASEPPSGNPKAIASILIRIHGSLIRDDSGNEICRLG